MLAPLLNVAQRRDALDLLHSLPNACTPLMFFDPQHRDTLDRLAYDNEGARQKSRALLPAIISEYIDACRREIVRVLWPSFYLMEWTDTSKLCEAHHLHIAEVLKCVDLIAWERKWLSFTTARRLFARPAETAAGR